MVNVIESVRTGGNATKPIKERVLKRKLAAAVVSWFQYLWANWSLETLTTKANKSMRTMHNAQCELHLCFEN